MIRPDQQQAAIRAVQEFLIRGRCRAQDGESVKGLERIFDDGEYLLALFLTPEDHTEWFAEYLEGATRRLHYPGIYERFAEHLDLAAV